MLRVLARSRTLHTSPKIAVGSRANNPIPRIRVQLNTFIPEKNNKIPSSHFTTTRCQAPVSNIKNSEAKPLLQYYEKPYKQNHWALNAPTPSDKNFIATLKIYGVTIALKLNPTDARGYRGIVSLVSNNKSKMASTLNREYSIKEELALSTALTIFARAYKNYGMIAQISVAGNNSQSICSDGTVQIGNEKEPSLLHGHIIGRGNPNTAYIAGVFLKGPKAGAEINLRGDGNDEGNQAKEKWNGKDMELVAAGLTKEVIKTLNSSFELQHVKIIAINQHHLAEKLPMKRIKNYYKFMIATAITLSIGTFFTAKKRDSNTYLTTQTISPKL